MIGTAHAPDFSYDLTVEAQAPRAKRAGIWLLVVFVAGLAALELSDGRRPLLAPWWLPVAWLACMGVMALVTWRALHDATTPRSPGRWWVVWMLVWSGWLAGRGLVARMGFPPTPEEERAFVVDMPHALSVQDDFARSYVAWSALVERLRAHPPLDDEVADRIGRLERDLIETCDLGSWRLGSEAATFLRAGMFTPEVERTFLAGLPQEVAWAPRPDPPEAARRWIEATPRSDLGDGFEEAIALSIHDLVPDTPGFAAAIESRLAESVPAAGSRLGVSRFRNLLDLLDRLGLADRADALASDGRAVLAAAWVGSEGRFHPRAGFAELWSGPDGMFISPPETLAAIDLMRRVGVPGCVDLERLDWSLELMAHDTGGRSGILYPGNRFLAAEARRRLAEARPAAAGTHRFAATDAALLALVALLGWALFDIRRQPVHVPGIGTGREPEAELVPRA